MDPCDWGWEVLDNLLIPVWFEAPNLSSDTEYDLHIKNTLQNYNEDTDLSDISDSESEYDSDKFQYLKHIRPLMRMMILVVIMIFDNVSFMAYTEHIIKCLLLNLVISHLCKSKALQDLCPG